jgi:predicted RecA/RadA family phage recombinase
VTQLSAATARTYMQGDILDLPVKASSAIYEGSAIGFVSGYHRQLAAGDEFCGFALNDVASQTSDGDAYVRVRRRGMAVLTITSIAVTDIGKPVYASDGNAFTLTAGTDAHIGRVVGVYGTNQAIVAFDADRAGLGGQIALLTDSTGGTASDTLADVPGSYTEATLANQLASLAAKVNAILRMLG